MEYQKIGDFTPKTAIEILRRYVGEIQFCPTLCNPVVLCDGIVKFSEINYRFTIFIATEDKNRKNQIETLIHELLHVFCQLCFIRTPEKDIEAEMKKFYSCHPQFCDDIFSKIEANTKTDPVSNSRICRISRRMLASGRNRRQLRLRFKGSLVIT